MTKPLDIFRESNGAPTPPKGTKFCHRFMIPMVYAEAQTLQPGQQKVQAQMQFIGCLGVQCAIWDEKRNQCADKTNAEKLAEIAEELKVAEFNRRNAMTIGQEI